MATKIDKAGTEPSAKAPKAGDGGDPLAPKPDRDLERLDVLIDRLYALAIDGFDLAEFEFESDTKRASLAQQGAKLAAGFARMLEVREKHRKMKEGR